MACSCQYDENTRSPTNSLSRTNIFYCDSGGESDFNYDDNCGKKKNDFSESETSVSQVFADGNEADFEACEYENELLERVWLLSKPPKIPRRTCVVPARRIQVIKERLSSTVNGLPTLSEDRGMKSSKRRQHVTNDIEYLMTSSFENSQKTASCQEKIMNIIPACARTIDELL